MQHESHEQYAFDSYKAFEIADALTANGANKIWVGLGDAMGHATGAWLTAEEARELAGVILRMADMHDARIRGGQSTVATRASGGAPNFDPTAFPG